MGFLSRAHGGLLAHFTADPRALTLFRLLLGLYALVDLCLRVAPSSGLGVEYYVSRSLLPWAPLADDDTPHTGPIHKVMFYRGPLALQLALFAFHFLVLLCFILTSLFPGPLLQRALARAAPRRLTMAISPLLAPTVNAALFWLLTILMHGRTDEFNDASDKLFRNIVIWTPFLPYPRLAKPAVPVTVAAEASEGGSAVAGALTYPAEAAPTGLAGLAGLCDLSSATAESAVATEAVARGGAGAAAGGCGVVEWPLLTVTVLRLLSPLAPLLGPLGRGAKRKRLALVHELAGAVLGGSDSDNKNSNNNNNDDDDAADAASTETPVTDKSKSKSKGKGKGAKSKAVLESKDALSVTSSGSNTTCFKRSSKTSQEEGVFAAYERAAVTISTKPADVSSATTSSPFSRSSPAVAAAACVGLLTQVCFLYIALAVDRWHHAYQPWLSLARGDAVHHVLGGSLAVRPLGAVLARLPYMTWLATVLTNPLEFASGLSLLLLPSCAMLHSVTARDRKSSASCCSSIVLALARAAMGVRIVAISLVFAFQLNLLVALRLPYFQTLSMLVMIPFFPPAWLDAADRGLANLYLFLKEAEKEQYLVPQPQDKQEESNDSGSGSVTHATATADADADAGDLDGDSENDENAQSATGETGELRMRKASANKSKTTSNKSADKDTKITETRTSDDDDADDDCEPTLSDREPSDRDNLPLRPRHSVRCSGLRAVLPWLMMSYALALICAYDFKLFKRLPDDGDIGEAIRYNQRWLMFSPPPDSYFYWTATAHYTLAPGSNATADANARWPRHKVPLSPPLRGAAATTDNYNRNDNGNTLRTYGEETEPATVTATDGSAPAAVTDLDVFTPPLPFDVFAALRTGRWAHPADFTVAQPFLRAAAAAAARARGLPRAAVPATRTTALAMALSALSPLHNNNNGNDGETDVGNNGELDGITASDREQQQGTLDSPVLRVPLVAAHAFPRITELTVASRRPRSLAAATAATAAAAAAANALAVTQAFAAAAATAATAAAQLRAASPELAAAAAEALGSASAAPAAAVAAVGDDAVPMDVYPFTRALYALPALKHNAESTAHKTSSSSSSSSAGGVVGAASASAAAAALAEAARAAIKTQALSNKHLYYDSNNNNDDDDDDHSNNGDASLAATDKGVGSVYSRANNASLALGGQLWRAFEAETLLHSGGDARSGPHVVQSTAKYAPSPSNDEIKVTHMTGYRKTFFLF